MSYYFEIWLRGFAKDYLREISKTDNELYHPHITLVRPFEIKDSENHIIDAVTKYCKGQTPIFFTLEGSESFDDGVMYIPVTSCEKLKNFNSGLEKILSEHVEFYPKLSDEKVFHATVKELEALPKISIIEQYMLRMTGIKNRKIWFSYDFVKQEVLNRDESLNKDLWYNTINMFLESNNLKTTKMGFKIDS